MPRDRSTRNSKFDRRVVCVRAPVSSGDRNFSRGCLAICACPQPLRGGLLAVVHRGTAILGGEHAMLGGRGAVRGSSLALLSSAHDDLDAKVRPSPFLPIGDVALRHHQIARIGGLVSRGRGDLACVRDRWLSPHAPRQCPHVDRWHADGCHG